MIPVAVAVASLTVGAGAALAGGGGTDVPDPPKVADVACLETCAGIHTATSGSKVEASGRHLGNVTAVLFHKKGGGRISVDPTVVRARSVRARVPDGAADGRPKVVDSYQNSDLSPTELEIVSPDQIPSSGNFKLQEATASPARSYYEGLQSPVVQYTFSGTEATDVRISVVHTKDNRVVDTWVQDAREPNAVNVARWSGGSRVPNGAYRFRIGPISGGLESTNGATFNFYKFKFPVRGPHQYWDGFGAPRAGHSHMGQDVGADCGTPLVAVRGGIVQHRAYQAGGAGYYVVLDGKRDNHDYMYAHLKDRASVREGERVKTGQQIGAVGQTGDASGCHLHFEYWSNDWWNGGRPLSSVTKVLRRWDSWS